MIALQFKNCRNLDVSSEIDNWLKIALGMLTIESPSAFSALAHPFIISYGYYDSIVLLTKRQGGQEMKVTQAGKLWLDYHRSNSQKKYG